MDNRVLKEDVIVVPATLADGVEVFSEVFHTNAQQVGEVFVSVADISKIGVGGSFVATAYGSSDGVIFFAQGTSTIAYGASGSATGVAVAKFAPYFKVGVKNTSAALLAAHGIAVDAVIVERDSVYKRAYDYAVGGEAVVTLTVTAADASAGILSVTLPGLTAVNVTLAGTDDTVGEVATKIAAGTYTGWTRAAVGAVVTFTKVALGPVTGTPSFAAGTTGAAGTIVITKSGDTAPVIVAPHLFEEVEIVPYQIEGTVDNFEYDVYTSNDNVTWYKVATRTDGETYYAVATSFKDIGLLKYVKVEPTAVGGTGFLGIGLFGIGY